MIQILNKTASQFSIDGASLLELSAGKIIPSDFTVSTGKIYGSVMSHTIKANGDFFLTTATFADRLYTIPLDLSAESYVTFSDNDPNAKYGMTIDDDGNIYISCFLNNGFIKKYQPDGTHLWTYNASGSVAGKYYYGAGIHFYDNRIFSTSIYNHTLFVNDKDGNLIQEINVTTGGTGLTRPRAVFVDDSGIYVVCNNGKVGKYNVSTYAFIEVKNLPADIYTGDDVGIIRLSDGNFIIQNGLNSLYSFPFMLVDSNLESVDELTFTTQDPINNAVKGGIYRSAFTYCPILLNESNKTIWYTSFWNDNFYLIKATMKIADDRFATLQHDFGSSITLEKVIPFLEVDNRKTEQQFKLWLQYDDGGYNLIDLTSLSNLNQSVKKLDIKIGLTDWRFINRNNPEFFGVAIRYNDGLTGDVFEQPMQGIIETEKDIHGEVIVEYELEGEIDEN